MLEIEIWKIEKQRAARLNVEKTSMNSNGETVKTKVKTKEKEER